MNRYSTQKIPSCIHINDISEINDREFLLVEEDIKNIDINFFEKFAPLNSQAYIFLEDAPGNYFCNSNFIPIKYENSYGLKAIKLFKIDNTINQDSSLKLMAPTPIKKKRVNKTEIKCIFLDRDGILISDTGYPFRISDFKLNNDITSFLLQAKNKGYKFIITTNQSGLARGIFNEEDYNKFTHHMINEFSKLGIEFLEIFHCPFHEEGTVPRYCKKSILRKPYPGLHLMAMNKYNINIDKSLMIGDKESDRIYFPSLRSFVIKNNFESLISEI